MVAERGTSLQPRQASSLNFLDKHSAALQQPLPYYISTGINDLRSPVASESVVPTCNIGADHPNTILKCQGNISIARRRVQFCASAFVRQAVVRRYKKNACSRSSHEPR